MQCNSCYSYYINNAATKENIMTDLNKDKKDTDEQTVTVEEALNMFGGGLFDHDEDYYDDMDTPA